MANSNAVGVAYSDPAISGGTVDNTPVGATTASSGAFTTLTANSTTALSGATTISGTTTLSGATSHTGSTLGFYGKTAGAQRAYSSAVHATSAASVSASFGATQLAILQELVLTNIALGIWATA